MGFHDLRHSLRLLVRQPVFTASAVLILALGIAANTAVFSTVYALLWRPYPFAHLDQLMRVRDRGVRGTPQESHPLAVADFLDLREERRAWEELAAFRLGEYTLTGNDEPVRVIAVEATANFFQTLGVTPAQGRAFASDEDQPGRDQVAVISDTFWRERMTSDPHALGRVLQLNGRAFTVVGILPAKVTYPAASEVWMSMAFTPQERQDRSTQSLLVVGRMRSGWGRPQVQAELTAMAARLAERFPTTNRDRSYSLLPVRQEQYEYTGPMFLLLQGAAVFVLLLACANVAGLFFARGVARRKEIAVRQALGAGGGRLASLLLSEALLLALLAGAAGLGLAAWLVDLIRNGVPIDVTKWVGGWQYIRLEPAVLAFAVAVTLLAGLGFGLAAGWQASRIPAISALREGSAPGRHGQRLLRALIVGEITFALVLLAGAGLLSQGFWQTLQGYRALDPAAVLNLRLVLPASRYPGNLDLARFYGRILPQIRQLPGVQFASAVRNRPNSSVENPKLPLTVEGRPALSVAETPKVDVQIATSGFVEALRIPVLEGRAIGEQETRDAPQVAVISRSLACTYWPNRSPIGARIKLGLAASNAPWLTVVGVVGDVKQNWFDPLPRPTVYRAYQQAPSRGVYLAIRAAGDPLGLAQSVRGIIHQEDPTLPVGGLRTLEAAIAEDLTPIRMVGMLMLVFGAVALLLASLGIYGTLAYAVEQRLREFSVRLALGARPGHLWRLVLSQGLTLSAVGLGIGIPLALAMSRMLASRIFGLLSLNWLILTGAAVLLGAVALAAGVGPARRASRVPPMDVLRCS